MRERLARFMVGRYGNDQLNRAILILALVILVILFFIPKTAGGLLSPLVLVLLGFTYYRMLSRNIYKRQEENGKYLRLRYKVIAQIDMLKERWRQRRDYKFFSCPSCHTNLRVPRGRGKIKIVCRKCGNSFVRKS